MGYRHPALSTGAPARGSTNSADAVIPIALRREIIATNLAKAGINRGGPRLRGAPETDRCRRSAHHHMAFVAVDEVLRPQSADRRDR